MTENYIFDNSGAINSSIVSGWIGSADNTYITVSGTKANIIVNNDNGKYNPQLVFSFIKKNKFTLLGKMRYQKRIKKLKKLAEKYAIESQDALSKKFLNRLSEEIKLSEVVGTGIKLYVRKDLINKYKYKIKGGHISDTLIDKYTNPIPSNILKRYKFLKDTKVFDKFVVYHYYNEKLEEKKEKKNTKINKEEKGAMKDPILFAVCKELPDILFFVDDWEDEYCDLSFDELVDVLPIKDEDMKIPREPSIINN